MRRKQRFGWGFRKKPKLDKAGLSGVMAWRKATRTWPQTTQVRDWMKGQPWLPASSLPLL